MKNISIVLSSKLRRVFSLVLITLSTLAVISCKKVEQVTTNISFLRIINASPTLGTFDTYINAQKANSGPLPFGGVLRYVQPTAGSCVLRFTVANDLQTLFTKSINLTADVAYSYYLIDKGTNLDGLLITDVMGSTATDKAYVKFINLSPDASALSLNVQSGMSLAALTAYKATSEFIAVDVKKQSFEIKDAAGNVKTTLVDETLAGGRYYTIIARGLLNPGNNEQAFSAQAIINQ